MGSLNQAGKQIRVPTDAAPVAPVATNPQSLILFRGVVRHSALRVDGAWTSLQDIHIVLAGLDPVRSGTLVGTDRSDTGGGHPCTGLVRAFTF